MGLKVKAFNVWATTLNQIDQSESANGVIGCLLLQTKEGKRLKEFLEDYDDDRDDPKFYR